MRKTTKRTKCLLEISGFIVWFNMEFTKDKRPKYTFKWIQFKLKTFLRRVSLFLAYMMEYNGSHSSSNNQLDFVCS